MSFLFVATMFAVGMAGAVKHAKLRLPPDIAGRLSLQEARRARMKGRVRRIAVIPFIQMLGQAPPDASITRPQRAPALAFCAENGRLHGDKFPVDLG